MYACLAKPEYFYWEVLECLRKLLLTGVAVAIIPGSLIQSVVSLGVIVVYAVAVAQFKPYRTARDNTLALILYSMLAVTLFIGLLLKVRDPSAPPSPLSLTFLSSLSLSLSLSLFLSLSLEGARRL